MTQFKDTSVIGAVQGALLDDPEFLKSLVERMMQQILETEMTEHIGAEPYQRTDQRKGHRNGYKYRGLKTRVGTLELLVPQDREGTFRTELFDRYQRNEKALVLAMMEMYVQGVSTRKVSKITEELCGTSFSKSTVSRLAEQLDEELDLRFGPRMARPCSLIRFADFALDRLRTARWTEVAVEKKKCVMAIYRKFGA